MAHFPGLGQRFRQVYHSATLFREDRIGRNFTSAHRLFPSVDISPRSTGPAPPPPKQSSLPALDWRSGRGQTWDQWLAESRCSGLLIQKHKSTIVETYREGMPAQDARIVWSVTKSILSALIGICVDKGMITSIKAPVTDYAPQLADTAFAKASIEQVLMMSSGVYFDEDYMRFWSDVNRLGRRIAFGLPLDAYIQSRRKTRFLPGQSRHYSSLDTYVVGMVLRGASQGNLAELMRDALFEPAGLTGPCHLLTDHTGQPMIFGGLMLTLRDMARLGCLFRDNGKINGTQLISASWVETSTSNVAPPDANGFACGYGYQWWLPPDPEPGEFFANGVYGQYLYVNRPRGTVVAMTSLDRQFANPDRQSVLTNLSMFRAIAHASDHDGPRKGPPRDAQRAQSMAGERL